MQSMALSVGRKPCWVLPIRCDWPKKSTGSKKTFEPVDNVRRCYYSNIGTHVADRNQTQGSEKMIVDLEKEIAELSNWRIVASGPNGFIRTCKTPAELRTWLRAFSRPMTSASMPNCRHGSTPNQPPEWRPIGQGGWRALRNRFAS